MPDVQKDSGLATLVPALRARLEPDEEILDHLYEPNLVATRELVVLIDRCLDEMNRRAGLEPEAARLIRRGTLQAAFPVFITYRRRETDLAAILLVRLWTQVAEVFGTLVVVPEAELPAKEIREPSCQEDPASDGEFLTLFQAAVLELLLTTRNHQRGREILRRAMAFLGLSFDQLGRMFRVSGETARRWERGDKPITDERLALLSQADGALTRLLDIFQPDRLRQVVRRQAELFDHESALDWILRGRIDEVADRYETALSYQA